MLHLAQLTCWCRCCTSSSTTHLLLPLLYFQRAPLICRCHRCTSSSTTHLLLPLLYFNERHSSVASTAALHLAPLTCFATAILHLAPLLYFNECHSPVAANAVLHVTRFTCCCRCCTSSSTTHLMPPLLHFI